ncbi:ornithine carbamoyltransferase [Litoreibacter meonggei]|uniref:Ornithine carbamoyltransferase n=1 Tax=Litoreibacter meonggei TaxID=1049199 RepID=A0A497X4K7_9RHOB|nr:ornithine carbamoyltransferase [Litoreibacter meonggei]RLJ60132.1 ornithine carbamoyltransferase [Litoreibacter meonggei]
MKKCDLLSISDIDLPTLERLAVRAIELGTCWQNRDMPRTLAGARIGLIEELPGWRNPTALALGAAAMGGITVPVAARLEGAEAVEDLAGYMDNWFDLLAVRTPSLSRLRQFADALDAPVLNLRTNDNHPCEILGDLAFVLSKRGSWDGLQVAMVGPAGNIARSWFEAAETLPIDVVQVAPKHLQFPAADCGTRRSVTDNPLVIENADLIITDCWPSNLTCQDKTELSALRIDADLLERCKPDLFFVPCPPVTRGEEVSSDAMSHPSCFAKSAKAFLMHAQNAVMEAAL